MDSTGKDSSVTATLGSQGQRLVSSCFLISFLRGQLINHGTPPRPRMIQSNPVAPDRSVCQGIMISHVSLKTCGNESYRTTLKGQVDMVLLRAPPMCAICAISCPKQNRKEASVNVDEVQVPGGAKKIQRWPADSRGVVRYLRVRCGNAMSREGTLRSRLTMNFRRSASRYPARVMRRMANA